MKKRLLITVAVILIVVLGAFALTACEPENTHKGVQTIEIRTAQELLSLKDNLGSDYDQTTYKLMNDIDLSDETWTPVGKNYAEAFCSDFDGNGHSITGVRIFNETVSEDRETSSTIGFFGFTIDSEIKNLTISIAYDFIYDTEMVCAGGLIGYAFGDTILSDITVNGEMSVNLVTDYEDIKAYIGGVIGSSTGSISMTNVTNNATVLADRRIGEGVLGSRTETNRLHTAYAGGVAGYIRTVDLSIKEDGDEVTEDNTFQNVVNNGDITVYAERLNAGGVFGSVYNSSSATNIRTGAQTALLFDCALRANAGGLIGYADNITLADAECNAVVSEVARVTIDQEENKIFNVGGLIGYAANGVIITDSSVDTVIMLDGAVDFAGGLVGVLSDSEIKDCSATGEYIYKSISGTMYNVLGDAVIYSEGNYIKDESSTLTNMDYRKWSGAVGKMFGAGKISYIDIDMYSYCAVLCTKVDRVKAKKDGGFDNFNGEIENDDIFYAAEKVREWVDDKDSATLYGNPVLPDPPEDPQDPQNPQDE